MQEIASQGKIETEALIQHIIDGVQDNEASETILYGAMTLHELKRKFEVYDRMKERTRNEEHDKEKIAKTDKQEKIDKKLHCFGCGVTDHNVENCIHKDKGPKCFRYNRFGCIASICTKTGKTQSNQKSVNIIRTTDIKTISVVINGIKIEALLDTGSDVNLIREDISIKIENPELLPTNRVFMDLGNVLTISIGKLHRYLNINDNLF